MAHFSLLLGKLSFPERGYGGLEPELPPWQPPPHMEAALQALQQEYTRAAAHVVNWLQDAKWRAQTLGRILTACEGKTDVAVEMLGKVMQWRRSFGTDTLPFLPPPQDFLRGFTPEELRRQYTRDFRDPDGGLEQILRTIRKSYVAAWHKWDRQGHPIYIERAGYTDARLTLSSLRPLVGTPDKRAALKQLNLPAPQPGSEGKGGNEAEFASLLKSHVLVMELGEHLCKVQSAKMRTPVSQYTYICDMANWGWKNMYGPAFEILRRAVEIDKNYYPESMHCTVVVNAPPLMSAVWALVKPMLPPRTRGKVQILRHGPDQDRALAELVDPEHLPEFLGGKCKCHGGCVPLLPPPTCSEN
eukprot:RCo017066